MSDFASIIFCRRCNSRYVEINEWTEDKKCIFHCRTCNTSEVVENFTMGRCKVPSAELQIARETKAIPGKSER